MTDKNPATLQRWPYLLPSEIALKTGSIRDICDSYNISEEQWQELKDDPAFRQAVLEAVEMAKKDGFSAKTKFKLVAESLIPEVYKLANTMDIPPSVRLDAIKFAARCAGYDQEGKNNGVQVANGFQVVINLGTNG